MRKSNKKGQVAGLGILLAVVVTIFIIGLLVFIFNYMGYEIESDLLDSTTEYINLTGGAGTTVRYLAPQGGWSATNTSNGTQSSPVTIYGLGNNLNFSGNTVSAGPNLSSAEIGLTFDYYGDTAETMNDTRTAITDTTDWFGIIIVISAMVVLILLTVIIIRAIRGGGLMVGGGRSGGERGSA